MLEWDDKALMLSARPFGEDASIINVLTENYGRHAGMVRGGQSRTMRPVLQAGNAITVSWRARLQEHLGNMTVEMTASNISRVLDNPLRLAGLASMCVLIEACIPEREPARNVFEATNDMIKMICGVTEDEVWLAGYIRWEIGLLSLAGFGLQLDYCGVSGESENLAYVSPRTGVAVTAEVAGEHAPKLLPLPGFLGGAKKNLDEDLVDGIRLTGHFFAREIYGVNHRPIAEPRQRFEDIVVKKFGERG